MFCRTPVWWLRGVCIGKFLPFQSDSPWPLRPKSTTSLVWTGAVASTALITTVHFISLSDSPIEWKLHEGKDSAVFSGSRNVAGYIYKSTHVLLLLFSTVSQSLLRFTSIESVKLSNHLILCRSLLLLPSIFPRIRVGKPKSWLWASGGQCIGASASVLSMNIQGWFPLEVTGLISLVSKGLSRIFSSTIILKVSILRCSAFFMVQPSHPYKTTGKTIALTTRNFVSKVMSLAF